MRMPRRKHVLQDISDILQISSRVDFGDNERIDGRRSEL